MRTRSQYGENVCPTCGKSFATPNALGAHRSKAHGYRAGDPGLVNDGPVDKGPRVFEKTVEAEVKFDFHHANSPVIMEQVIGELVYDKSGNRTAIGAALVLIADYVNAAKPDTFPIRFRFADPVSMESFTIEIDS